MSETFSKTSLLNFANNQYKMDEHGPHMMPTPPIFSKYHFFKNDPKNFRKVQNFKFFFCILDNHFIGLLYGILNVLILLVYPEKLKENLLLLNTFWAPLYIFGRICNHARSSEFKKIFTLLIYLIPKKDPQCPPELCRGSTYRLVIFVITEVQWWPILF